MINRRMIVINEPQQNAGQHRVITSSGGSGELNAKLQTLLSILQRLVSKFLISGSGQ